MEKELGKNYNPIKKNRLIYQGIVTEVDNKNLGRLKVSIFDMDDDIIERQDLPWCIPFLDRSISLLPKVNEIVNIILSDSNNQYTDRFWVSRRFSEFSNIAEDYSVQSALKGSIHSKLSPKAEKLKDLFPDSLYEDLWILGRNNADIKFDDSSIELRIEKHKRNEPLVKNEKSARIKLYADKNSNTVGGVLADTILLLSNKSELKPNNDFDEERINALINKLSPIPRGDVLIEILNIFKDAILNHTHKFHNQIPNGGEQQIQRLKKTTTNKLNNNNIKIN